MFYYLKSIYDYYYYYKLECEYCKDIFLRDKSAIKLDRNVCSIQCFLNLKIQNDKKK